MANFKQNIINSIFVILERWQIVSVQKNVIELLSYQTDKRNSDIDKMKTVCEFGRDTKIFKMKKKFFKPRNLI